MNVITLKEVNDKEGNQISIGTEIEVEDLIAQNLIDAGYLKEKESKEQGLTKEEKTKLQTK